ncbi:MAG TPA: DUF4038 domain-containing protein [Bacteroidales bacterium]|nr:DUF4038 domain-containing protein [Bacteroidales bacterium]
MVSDYLYRVLVASILVSGGFITALAQDSYDYPLKISENNRYLTDQDNRPFFWSGDAAWSLIAQPDSADVNFYLNDRNKKGFTVLLVNLIEHKFCSHAPSNYYNEPPFTGKPFSTPNEDYFAFADFVIGSAAKRGMIVLLCPVYLGYNYSDEGWASEVKAASIQEMKSWGEYLGQRYSRYPNIIWCIGGDADPSPLKDKLIEVVKGIRESDTIHLFTSHNQPEGVPSDLWNGSEWMRINNVYSYDKPIYRLCKKAYEMTPVMPWFMMESAYENEHNSTPQQLRAQAYWPVLCGSMGHIFGNCPIWHYSSVTNYCELVDWKTQLDLPGSVSMDYLQRLFRSRPWNLLVPDFEHKVVVSGYGDWGSENYSTTAITADSSCMIAYIVSDSDVTVNMEAVSGKMVKSWWYNPETGNIISNEEIGTTGLHVFKKPTETDWVLVIDDAAAGYAPPGTQRVF